MKDDIYGTFKKRNNEDGKWNGANRGTKPEDSATGYWENLPDKNGNPTFIQNKTHLRQECEDRGVMAKMLLKPKSQGKGYEMTKKTGSSKYFFLG